MIEKSCRCGKIKKNFQIDIGPFFIAECCTEAGYNHLGELSIRESKLSIIREAKLVTPKDMERIDKQEIVSSTNIVQNYGTGEIISEKKATDDELKELNNQRKKRSYNRNGNLKKDQ